MSIERELRVNGESWTEPIPRVPDPQPGARAQGAREQGAREQGGQQGGREQANREQGGRRQERYPGPPPTPPAGHGPYPPQPMGPAGPTRPMGPPQAMPPQAMPPQPMPPQSMPPQQGRPPYPQGPYQGEPYPAGPYQGTPYGDETTVLQPALPPLPAEQTTETPREPATPSLAKASGSMAIATLVSRLTGFLRQLVLVGVITFGTVNDSYNVANNLPNIVYELLLGGVLASVVIPTLIRAQKEDDDDGQEFTQRLLTVSLVVLTVGTAIAVACAPLLTKVYFSSGPGRHPELTTDFSYLILPEILFYGIFGLLSGILNSRHVFKPAAWSPVLNNVVMFATLAVYAIAPGQISLDPVRMGEPKLLILGIGTTLGVVVQAVMLIPPLLRVGFRFRWRWGWDKRLGQFGHLAKWLVLYTLVSQVSYIVLTNVATGAAAGTYTIYTNSWLLLQVPYGVLGVSMLTAIMPRLSKSAADGDIPGIVDNLSTGSRMSAVMLIPLCAMITVLGPDVGQALFSIRHSEASSAAVLGLSLTTSAFGLMFYGITMLQLRVFYAMNDARTPTMINGIIVVVKVALFYTCSKVLAPHHVVYGLTFVNSFGYVVSSVVGNIWLHRRIGRLDTRRVIRTMAKTLLAAAWGAGAALLVGKGIAAVLPAGAELPRAWTTMIVGALVGLVVTFGLMTLLRVTEIQPVVRRLRRLAARG